MKIMNSIKNLLFLFLLGMVFQLGSCGGEDEGNFPINGTVLSMSDIAGHWEANSAIFSQVSDQPIIFDLITEGGSVLLSIQPNGRFKLTMNIPGEPSNVINGQLGFDEDLLVVKDDAFPDDWEYFGIYLDQLTLYISGPAEFDFDDNGVEDEAIISLAFERV